MTRASAALALVSLAAVTHCDAAGASTLPLAPHDAVLLPATAPKAAAAVQ